MKEFFKVLADLVDSMTKARNASILARQGKVEEAKKVYQ
jgi:hypothetical protein